MITTLLLLYTNMAAMTSHANQELVVVLPKRIFGFLSYAPSDHKQVEEEHRFEVVAHLLYFRSSQASTQSFCS